MNHRSIFSFKASFISFLQVAPPRFPLLQDFFVPLFDQQLYKQMISNPVSFDIKDIVDMIQQLILFGNVPLSSFSSFSQPQMPLLSKFLASLRVFSVPLPDLDLVLFRAAVERRSNPSPIPAPISEFPKTPIPSSAGKKSLFSFSPSR